MDDDPKRTDAIGLSVIFYATIHGMLWLVVFALLIFLAPYFERLFADFDVRLSALTLLILHVSNAMALHWPWAGMGFIMLAAGDLFVLLFAAPKAMRFLVAFALGLVPIFLIAVILVGLVVPALRLMDSLAAAPCGCKL